MGILPPWLTPNEKSSRSPIIVRMYGVVVRRLLLQTFTSGKYWLKSVAYELHEREQALLM